MRPKNRRATSATSPATLTLERERSGRGFRHVLDADHVFRFLSLLDDWDSLQRGLHTIRLAAGSFTFGYWRRGIVAVCALPEDRRLPCCHLDEHALRLFELIDARSQLDVCRGCGRSVDVFQLSIEQARAWQLLDVLCHELGHHHDAMTNRGGFAERGERYALAFAEERWLRLWGRYQRAFRI